MDIMFKFFLQYISSLASIKKKEKKRMNHTSYNMVWFLCWVAYQPTAYQLVKGNFMLSG